MTKSPEELAHQDWFGYVQPVGLVVSIPAMLEARCYVNKNIMGEHARFLGCLPREKADEPLSEIRDLSEFVQEVLGWESQDLQAVPQRVALTGDMAALEVVLPQYHETLRPTHAVPVFKPADGQNPWMMLVQELPAHTHLDEPSEADSARHWNAAPQAKFERLLRETGVPIGLLSNRRSLRLVYAPKGESSGHATFNVAEMVQVAGRPMFAALHTLLCADRMFALSDNQRLPAILEHSRKYQNTVSTKLAEQVLAALYELMRGFQAADDVRQGELLRDVLEHDPNHVYSGLLTVLMRLVFVMYAEDRDLLSSDPIYSNYYSVTGLFNRLREDAGRFPDTMNQRYGAWSQLITLFRLIYEGGQHGDFRLPARKGYLFDPDRYPFLEARHLSLVTGHLSVVTGHSSLVNGEEQMTNDKGQVTNDKGLMTNHPFTFLDHTLRHGDSLVGLTRRQIIGFHWEPKKQKQLGEDLIQRRLDRATEARAKILTAREDVPYRDQEQRLALANEALEVVRLTGDACVSAFFAGVKKKEREDRCEQLFADVAQHYQNLKDGKLDMAVRDRLAQAVAELRGTSSDPRSQIPKTRPEHPLPPFHWEIEFPEVFSRENGGFDAFVGNPPFAGKNTMANGNRAGYPDWLKELHAESHGNADLVAHFFRGSFNRLRTGGAFGLIATNTIGQGDTRSTGLRWICEHDGAIYDARRRLKWPGLAAVVVSVIHVSKGRYTRPRTLDDKPVDTITAFLFHRGGHADPARLKENEGKSYVGSYVLGMGFTFDDTDTKGVATPLAEMRRLIEQNPRNAERIFPYIGGEEINTSPSHAHHRYVINFGDLSEEEARTGWPDLMRIVEAKVKPERFAQKDKGAKERMVAVHSPTPRTTGRHRRSGSSAGDRVCQ